MTESEWASSSNPESMLRFLLPQVRDERLRLFACSSCRRIWHLLADGSRHAVRVAEKFAQGRASLAQLEAARWRAENTCEHWQGEEYVAEVEAGFRYTERYCVISAQLYASYAARAVAATSSCEAVVRRHEYLGRVEWTHSWVVAARGNMALACVFEAIRGDENETIGLLAGIWTEVARDGEMRAQADLLRRIIAYPRAIPDSNRPGT
jgi:hypothetical protein